MLGDVGNSQPRDHKPIQSKLKHVPLILQRNRSKEKVPPVREIKVKPKKEPKPRVKTESTSDDNPYPKPPYSYMAMIQVCAGFLSRWGGSEMFCFRWRSNPMGDVG